MANKTSGKSAYVNRTSPDLPNYFTSTSTVAWPARVGEENYKDSDPLKFEITFSSPEEENKARDFTDLAKKQVFDWKDKFFGAKAKAISSLDVLTAMFTPMAREGSQGKDGTRYPSTFRLTAYGWTSYIKGLKKTEKMQPDGEKSSYIEECIFSDRIVEPNNSNAPTERDVKFFILIGKNPLSGKPRYTDKVPVLNSEGQKIQIAAKEDGSPCYKMRYVGPQDMARRSRVVVVWEPQKIWSADGKAGITIIARQVYITPNVAQRAGSAGELKYVAPGLEIDENATLEETEAVSEALQYAAADDEHKQINAAMASAECFSPAPPQPSVMAAPVAQQSTSGSKRKSESAGGSAALKGSSAKKVSISEEF